MNYKSIKKDKWDNAIMNLLSSHDIYASVRNDFGQDYELLRPRDIPIIVYNEPKPVTSLKNFFLPVKENVSELRSTDRPRIIIGSPNCDIEALSILDEIYLDPDFDDPFYRERRENTLLIGSDCKGIQEHCHCLSYGIRPFPTKFADLAIFLLDDNVILRILSKKGDDFINNLPEAHEIKEESVFKTVENAHALTESLLESSNRYLPDYSRTGDIVRNAKTEIWKKYSARCVSCGACATICPTCTCFLLIDKPGFEKVKQLDACQYPGFARVAGGEDALLDLPHRFRNRYMCKYVWKPEKFKSVACTGCGRCIDACIAKINKNELFRELA